MDVNARELLRRQLLSLGDVLWKIPDPITEYKDLLASIDDPNVPLYQLDQRRKRLEAMQGICQKPVDAWPKTEWDYILPFGLPDFVPKVIRRHPQTGRDMSVFMIDIRTTINQYNTRDVYERYTDGKCIFNSYSGELRRYQAVENFGVDRYDMYEAFFEQFGRAQIELQFLPSPLRKIIELYLWDLKKAEWTQHYETSRGN